MQKNKYSYLIPLGAAVLFVLFLFAWQGNKGFGLEDEGFLWYGVQRVMVGEVPILDFMAYDPGRYYWSVALMGLLGGNGIMNLRAAVAGFQIIGLFIGLLLITRSIINKGKDYFPYLFLSGVTLVIWMYPRHKLFDISLSIILIGALTFLVEKPTARRYFFAGCVVGLTAVFGRNHGVYGVLGSLGVMLWLGIKSPENVGFMNDLPLWAIGVITGFAPVLLMALIVPDFAGAFWESILFLFEQKATNLPLAVPWPWTVNFADVSLENAIRGVLIGLFFIGMPVFGCLAMTWVLIQKFKGIPVSPVLVATAFLSLPYSHFAFSRADVAHLAQGIFPLLIGCLILLSTQAVRIKWPLAALLCAGSLWVMLSYHPGWQCLRGKHCVSVEISGSNLQVKPVTANNISLIRQLAEQYTPNGQSFIAAPFWPGAYALLERRSPMWDIYALVPRSQTFEKREIERIKTADPFFVLVIDRPLDGRDQLRFMNTHPLINQYFLDSFEPLQILPDPAYQIYKKRTDDK